MADVCKVREEGKETPEAPATFPEATQTSTEYKITKALVFSWWSLTLGFGFGLLGPTLPDLKDRFGVDYQEVSYGLAAQSIGMSAGGIAAGLTLDRLENQGLMSALGASTCAASYIGVGFTSSFYVFIASLFLFGFGAAFTDTGIFKEVIQLFASRASIPTHFLRFAFSIGGLTAPVVASIFLNSKEDDIGNIHLNTSTAEPPTSQIEYAYAISSIAQSTAAFCYLVFYFYDRAHKKVSTSTPSPSCNNCLGSLSCSHLLIIFFVSCFSFSSLGGTYLVKFAPSFGIECDLQMPIERAALLSMVYWISSAVTRLAGAVMSTFVRPRVLIIYQLICLIASALLVTFYGYYIEEVLWVAICLGGLGQGISWANGISFANEYVELKACTFMFFSVSGGIGAFTMDYVTGLLFDITPMAFAYVFIVHCCIFVVVFAGMQTTACAISRQKQGDYKLKKAQGQDEEFVNAKINMY